MMDEERERARAFVAGQTLWKQWGSSREHLRYTAPIGQRSRRRCSCGCRQRATHVGKANGIALMFGCELKVRRWVRDPLVSIRGAAND